MTRTSAREIAVHFSYEMGFLSIPVEQLLDKRLESGYFMSLAGEDELYSKLPDEKQLEYIKRLVRGVREHGAELDSYIEKYSIGWNFSRISRVAAAIMRVAMYEVLYMPDIPDGAAINEAVEIAKKYEEPDVVSFINGILGTFVRGEVEN